MIRQSRRRDTNRDLAATGSPCQFAGHSTCGELSSGTGISVNQTEACEMNTIRIGKNPFILGQSATRCVVDTRQHTCQSLLPRLLSGPSGFMEATDLGAV